MTDNGCPGGAAQTGVAVERGPGSAVPASALDDPQVHQAMEEYLRLLQAGERPDREAFLARYPAVAAALTVCLQGLDFVHAAGAELSHPAADGSRGGAEGDGAGPPQALGDFRIVREVGRGGMGVVYEAEQLSLKRRVALKVLPMAGILDERRLRRFQNEAQAAAGLHHTNIVPVHAVGSERGIHFYAMQFIHGQTVADMIRQLRQSGSRAGEGRATPDEPAAARVDGAAATQPEARQTTSAPGGARRDRELFRRVAELGVQAAEALDHAHQAGVVHRDVKPANLLVDGRGHLWVTDFGLAHVQQAEASLTMTGDLVGTLRYMSPEQALARRVVIDHRTDIYSLGATLYELLTLRPAFPGTERQELLRQIAFEEPRPPRRVNREVPAELETIVLKALEKNPGDRYATAQELADDLRRSLLHEPIRAKKPTWVQRGSKWSRRHPTVVRSALLMLVLLTAGSLLSTWLVWQEKEQARLALAAETAERNRADGETRIARERDAETTAVLDFVERRILAAARPEGLEGGLGREVKLRQALEAALPFVANGFPDQPLTEARLRRTMGLSFSKLGDEDVAAEQFLAARALYEKHRGPDDPGTLASANNLATSYFALGRRAEALQLREEVLARRRAVLGPDHPDTLASMNNLATSYDEQGRHAEALKLREETLEGRRKVLKDGDPDTLASMSNLAISYTMFGRHAQAVTLREEMLALHRAKFGPKHPRTLACMNNLAESYHALGRHADALALYEETLALAQAEIGPNHPKTLLVMNNLAWLLCSAEDVAFRDPARAVELATKAAQLAPKDARFLGTLGTARYRKGECKQAILDLERAIGLRSPEDCVNANEAFFLAMARWQLGDRPGARTWFDKGVAWMDKGDCRVDEVSRFRAEAAELLGIKDEAGPPDPQTPR